MCKTSKTRKIHNRVHKVKEDKLLKLYQCLPYICMNCCYNSNCIEKDKKDDTDTCNNHEDAKGLNELIEEIKIQNIDLDNFCKKYNLKKEFLMEMLKGNILFNYKYYVALCNRLHFEEYDEFSKYKERFELEENDKIEEVKNF